MSMVFETGGNRITRYEQLAGQLTRQIELGAYRPGHRIPSVRQASKEQGLSVSTVLQAYQLLEDQGWIEARPQSGYYVSWRMKAAAPEPECSAPPLHPSQVSIDDLALRMVHDATIPGVVQLGAAFSDPDLLPNKKLNKLLAAVLKKGDDRLNLCGIPEGIEELRIAVVKRAGRAGAQLNPDEILITNGAMEAVNLALRAVTQPGDLVAVESPTYFGMFQALEALHLQVLEIPTHHQTGINLEALRFALENHPVRALLLVPNFSNPLGSLMPEANKRQLASLLVEFDLPLIEDDIYGELHFEYTRPQVIKAFDTQGRVLLCSSFSKDISPSLRVGWIAPGRYYEQIRKMKMALNLGTAILPQMAVAAFLSSGGYDHHLRTLRREYAQRVAQMSQFILNHFPEGTHVTCPRGGFVLWVQLPEGVDSLALYRPALDAGISIAPGYMFSTTQKYRGYVRLNAAFWSYNTLGAVERLAQLVKEAARNL
ncbi:MAG: PLP-dependent aminotransferase family protein [Anaerolineaceae bacterium]|nr:PLP-dependent aminotransferase family protein [Anaerolineaceae bacterium]